MDGCITNDGDVFLYGARNVYKDLSISKKVRFNLCHTTLDYYVLFSSPSFAKILALQAGEFLQ